MSVIDDYLVHVPDIQKAELERVRRIARQAAPEAEEVISYGMPSLKYKGKYLLGFCDFKGHLSVFPGAEAVEILKPKLAGYTTAKGTIQFTSEHQLTEALIKKIVALGVARIDRKK